MSTLEAAPLSFPEMRRKSVRLGTSHVAVIYPEALDRWFDGLVEPRVEEAAPAKWVDLVAIDDSGRFAVEASSGAGARDLGLGEALAVFWERVSFLLVDDLTDAMALHAAAVRANGLLILMPGASGCGKTRLSLWYRKQGYELGSDEVVTISRKADGGPELAGALPRPVLLKSISDPSAFLRAGEQDIAQLASDYGVMLGLAGGPSWTPGAIERCLILFPRFAQGSPLILTPLSPGETAFRLMDTCLNVRNLPRGGLALASALADRAQAIALEYGDTSQLEQTLDVLTRQWLAAPMLAEDFAALCAAFAARDSIRSAVPAAARAEKRPVPAATAQRFPRRLTVGMATYDDYDGVYFTIQSLRNTNPELEGELEFVVIDNNPGSAISEHLSNLGNWIDGYRYVPRGEWSGTAMRNAVFEEASSPFVLCIDSHVLIAPGALAKLIAYFEADPSTRDLLQGPMVYDDLRKTSTHFEPVWRAGMWGTWADDTRGDDPTAPPFDIPMQGLGLFASRRDAWAGFNSNFRGFGGEEGYIHEKTRQRGGRTLCLPFLRWVHRFNRPGGAQYVNLWEHRIRNYYIGFTELGLPTDEMEVHFAELLGAELAGRIFRDIRRELNGGG